VFAVPPDRAETPLILAIDIGTSSVRASLFDRLGRTLEGSEARQSHEIHTTVDGAAETDPDGLVEIVCGVLDRALTKAGLLIHAIGGVATCTFVSNVLGIDKAGRSLTRLVTYADTRAEGEVTALRREFDETEIHDRTGCHFHPCYLPAFFRWFARNNPDRFRKITRWISIGEYLELKLFGETAASYSAASWTGLLNRHGLTWDKPLLTALQIRPEQLSPLVDANIPRKGLLPQFAKRWPALSEIPWYPAIADGAAANIGSGCVSPARVALTIGTTSAVRAVITSSLDHIPYGLWCYRVDGRRSLIGAALNEGGNIFAWITNRLRLGDLSELEPTLARMSPDAHGLTILPFLAGERAPGWAGHARGIVHGLSFATTSLDILRAGLEAVAYRVAIVFDLLCKVLPKDPLVVASGGALLSSPTWIQIMADVLAHPISISEVQEASSRGTALLALESLGTLNDLAEVDTPVSRTVQPDLKHHAPYREAMTRQMALYEKLIEGWKMEDER
jgi:gluconokinase